MNQLFYLKVILLDIRYIVERKDAVIIVYTSVRNSCTLLLKNCTNANICEINTPFNNVIFPVIATFK